MSFKKTLFAHNIVIDPRLNINKDCEEFVEQTPARIEALNIITAHELD